MSETTYYNVGTNFDLNGLVTTLAQSYRADGFLAKTYPMTTVLSMRLEKKQKRFQKNSRSVSRNYC